MKLILSLTMLSWMASANAATAARLKTLKIESLDNKVQILKTTKGDQATVVYLGLGAKVNLGDACTTFVGQEDSTIRTKFNRVHKSIQAMGSFDVLADACIEVMPEPLETTLTIGMALPKAIPSGDLTYYQDIQIGDKMVHVTFKPNDKPASAAILY